MDNDGRPTEQFSLASIFLLTIAVAVLAAAARTGLVANPGYLQQHEEMVGTCAGAGGVLGFFTGMILGIYRFPTGGRGMLYGMAAGWAAGLAGGAVAAIPDTLLPIAIGSVVLVGFAAVVRYLSR